MLTSFSLHSSCEMSLLALVSKAGLSLCNGKSNTASTYLSKSVPSLSLSPVCLICCVVVEDDVSQVSTIPFSQSDMIVGAGHQEEQLFVFTRSHGVINVTSRTIATTRGKGKKKTGIQSK